MRRSLPLLCAAISSLIGSFSLPIACIALHTPGPTGIRENDTFDRQAISGQLRQLEAVIREIGERKPAPREEYEQAKMLADELIEETRKPGFFWLRVPLDTRAEPKGTLVHDHLSTWLGTLDAISARVGRLERLDRVEKHHDLLLRLFRDAETRRIQRAAGMRDQEMVKESILFALYREKNRLESSRDYLRSQRKLGVDDWILLVGGLLWEGPQHLRWHDDVAFASLEALQQSGTEVVAGSRIVTLRNEDQRLDLPIIHSMDPTGRSAYRDPAGRIYIPVDELAHRKIAHVRIAPDPREKANHAIGGPQIVFISPGVEPEYITPPDRMRLPETRRKLPAEK